jgi:predicted adenylyl cyclase CyaB
MDREIEAKFYVCNLHEIHNKLCTMGARQTHPRTRLLNDRYDTVDRSLQRDCKVLRIRTNTQCWLTFKAPGEMQEERVEIEFTIGDPAAAERLLNALGYERFCQYETFRETYALDNLFIMLDELPIGTFVEIEGPSVEEIHNLAERLDLKWETRIRRSYKQLFLSLRRVWSLDFIEATFDNFQDLPAVLPTDLGVEPADGCP